MVNDSDRMGRMFFLSRGTFTKKEPSKNLTVSSPSYLPVVVSRAKESNRFSYTKISLRLV